MAKPKFCGSIVLNPSEFKVIDGVITLIDETAVDVSDAISACGQLWDGEYFRVIQINGAPCITIATDPEHELLNGPYKIHGSCGLGLDGRIFQYKNGEVGFVDGYTLTVIVTPADATIGVHDGEALVEPTVPGGNQFYLTKVGGNYSVTVQKDGYTGKSQTIENMGNQTVTVELEQTT